eukprot:scaffold107118_cov21-Tisochrysis_lutea.AAC.1
MVYLLLIEGPTVGSAGPSSLADCHGQHNTRGEEGAAWAPSHVHLEGACTLDLGVLDGKTMEQSLAAAMARPHRLSPRTRAHTDTHTHTLLPMHTCMVLSLSCAAGNGQHASPVQLDACVCWKKVPCGYVTKDAPNVCKTPKGCIGANATKDASQWC